MENKIKKINFNHSFIFFLFCNVFSLITFVINNFTISPLICLLLILSIGISHGSLDNLKGEKLLKIFGINNLLIFYISYILIAIISNNFMDNHTFYFFNNFFNCSFLSLWKRRYTISSN